MTITAIYYNLAKQGFYDPDQPENHRKGREEGKGVRARERKTSNNLQFLYLKTNQGQIHSQTLTKGDLVFKNPARYTYIGFV